LVLASRSAAHRPVHSFPTRRSSDLWLWSPPKRLAVCAASSSRDSARARSSCLAAATAPISIREPYTETADAVEELVGWFSHSAVLTAKGKRFRDGPVTVSRDRSGCV